MTRPSILKGNTYKSKTGCGNIYITINSDETGIKEIFTLLGKAGSCSRAENESIARCISIGLQSGTPVEAFVKTLCGVRCDKIIVSQDHITSCADAIAKALEEEQSNIIKNHKENT